MGDGNRALAKTLTSFASGRYQLGRVLGAGGPRPRGGDRSKRPWPRAPGVDLPLVQARLHVELARLLTGGDADEARLEARAAVAICSRVGIALAEDELAVLRGLDVAPPG